MPESLFDSQIFFILLGCLFFVISFFSMETGLCIMAVSMLFSPEIAIGSIGIRSISIRIEDILIPILMMAWLARMAIKQELRGLIRDNPLKKPVFWLLGLSITSTIWGIATGWCSFFTSAFYIAKTVEFFIIYFLVVNYVRTVPQIKIFFAFALLTVALLGFYTIFQVPSNRIFTEHRITAPFEGTAEPATVGGYMAFLLLIIFSIFLYEKRPGRKWAYGVIGLMTLVPFIFTLNRTSYAALIVGLLFIAFVVKKRWLTTTLICLLLLSPFWAPKQVKERIAFTWQDAKNPGRDLGIDYSSAERLYVFKKLWNTLKFDPVFGLGVASFDYSDNQYARTLHEIGFVGLGFWIWIFVRLGRMSRWLYESLEEGFLKGMVLGWHHEKNIFPFFAGFFAAILFCVYLVSDRLWQSPLF